MQTITIPMLKRVIRGVAFDLDEPIMVVGQFGAGKSEAANQACEEVGAHICDIRLGQYDSVDMRGFPGVDRETRQTVWHAPSTLPFIGNDAFPDDKPIALVLDEITSATAPVAANAYQLINDRAIGEHRLKPNVRIIALGNRELDKGVVNRMPFPLANRMTWFELVVDVEAWCDWAQSVGIHPIFVAFMNFRKPLLCTYDPAKPEKVVATPRTWAKAAKYFASGMMDDIKRAAMQGAIGEGPSVEFWGFYDVWQKIIPIKKIIADPTGTPVPQEASMSYATAINISGSLTAKNISPLYTYLKRMPPEFMVMAWQLALKRDRKLSETRDFVEFSKQYRVVFQA